MMKVYIPGTKTIYLSPVWIEDSINPVKKFSSTIEFIYCCTSWTGRGMKCINS